MLVKGPLGITQNIILAQVIALCWLGNNYYLEQRWTSSIMPYCITWPHWEWAGNWILDMQNRYRFICSMTHILKLGRILRLQQVAYNIHDDIIKWKHFLHYWPFVRGIHWSPVDSPHKGQWCRALMFSLICTWKTVEQTSETPVIWDAIVLIMMSL